MFKVLLYLLVILSLTAQALAQCNSFETKEELDSATGKPSLTIYDPQFSDPRALVVWAIKIVDYKGKNEVRILFQVQIQGLPCIARHAPVNFNFQDEEVMEKFSIYSDRCDQLFANNFATKGLFKKQGILDLQRFATIGLRSINFLVGGAWLPFELNKEEAAELRDAFNCILNRLNIPASTL